MNNLYVILDTICGFFPSGLDILSLVSLIFAVLVITIRNPVISVLFLIGLFFGIACYLISIGINFIGLSYLLVYVGAVSILFLFILMLINIRVSELVSETKNSIPLVFIVTILFYNASIILPVNNHTESSYTSNNNWENTFTEFDHISSIGNVMYTNLAMWLLLVSLILLLAMVGAIVITIKQDNVEWQLYSFTLRSDHSVYIIYFGHLWTHAQGLFPIYAPGMPYQPGSDYVMTDYDSALRSLIRCRARLVELTQNNSAQLLSEILWDLHMARVNISQGNDLLNGLSIALSQAHATSENLGSSEILAHVKAIAAAKANVALDPQSQMDECWRRIIETRPWARTQH